MRIDIIDDDKISRLYTKFVLKKFKKDLTIFEFENAEEYLILLKTQIIKENNLPNIILLDLNMPIMSGWQFLEEYSKLIMDKYVRLYVLSSEFNFKKLDKYLIDKLIIDTLNKPLSISKACEILY